MNAKAILRPVIALVLLTMAHAGHAALITVSGTWSQTGGPATATSTMIVDTTLLTPDGASLAGGCGPCTTPIVPGWVSGFSLTVVGASAGNGTFAQALFSDIFLDTSTPPGVVLAGDLVPQAGFVDFNFFAAGPGTPTGVAVNTFVTSGGDTLTLRSLVVSAVPEPTTLAIMALGLLGVARRRCNSL